MTGPGSPPSRPPSEEPTLAGEEPAPSSRPASEDDTWLAGESVAVVRTQPAELEGGEPSRIGRYEILRRIGEGGMGLIFEARDPELERKVAIKLVRPALHERSDDARTRLLREAQTLAKITHPNVIHVYEVGTFGEQVFVAMEFVDGHTLRDWQWKEHVTWRAILDAYVAAARGLAAAHARGMVHRDFKPDNVLIGADGKVRVIDFGLARGGGIGPDPSELDDTARDIEVVAPDAIDVAQPLTRLTKTGAILGTPAYMAPEQHHGQPADGRSDQFSFSVALYEALYGMRPFSGKTYPALVFNVLNGKIEEEPRFVEVPPWIRRALLRGLSVEPEDRFPSMDALVDELRADPRTRTRRRGYVAATVALGLVGIGAWRSVESTRELRREREQLRAELARHRFADAHTPSTDAVTANPARAWNAYVLAHAKARLASDPSAALASLRSLSAPNPDTIIAARLVAERALRRGVASTFPDADHGIDLIATSPNGRYLLLGSREQIEVWDGRMRKDSLVSPNRVTSCAIGDGGTPIVVGHDDGSVLYVGDAELLIDLHEHPITAVAVSPATGHFATADASGDVVVWELVDGRARVWRHAQRHAEAVRTLVFGADGESLASGGDDGRVVRWNFEAKTHRDLESGAVSVSAVVWEGSEALAVLGSDGSVTRWLPEAGSHEVIASDVRHLTRTAHGLLAFDAEGSAVLAEPELAAAALGPGLLDVRSVGPDRLVSLDDDGRVRTWTVRSPRPTPTGDPLAGAWLTRVSDDGELIVAATHDGRVEAWDRASGESRLKLEALGNEITALALAPDAATVIARTDDGRLHGARVVADAPVTSPSPPRWSTIQCGNLGPPIAWSPDGAAVATFECAPQGLAVRTPDGEEVARAHFDLGGDARTLRFSSDASQVYADAGPDVPVRIVDAHSGLATLLEWAGPAPTRRLAQAWTADGLVRVAGIDADGALGLWQQAHASGPLLHVDTQPIESAQADASSTFVLTSHAQGMQLLWDLGARTQQPLPALPDDLAYVSITPDGRWLLAQPSERSQPEGTLIHVPSGTSRAIPGLFPPATLQPNGTLVDANGERVRVWASPVPETWSVFRAWSAEVTDPVGAIDMSIGPVFDE